MRVTDWDPPGEELPDNFQCLWFDHRGKLRELAMIPTLVVSAQRNACSMEQIGKQPKTTAPIAALPPDESEPVRFVVSRMRSGRPVEGLTARDINVDVVAIIDAAKASVREGKPVAMPAE